MKFSSYTLALTYFMAALGLWAVSLVETVEPLFAAAGAAAVIFSLALNVKKKTILSQRLWNVLAAGVVIFFAADYFAASGSLVGAASRALTMLLALKLFDLRTNRDYITVYAIVFFQILAAASSTVSPVFILIIALFIFDVIFAMTVFNIKKEMLLAGGGEKDVPPGLFDTPFFASVIAVSAASLIITFALFFVMPRMGVGFLERKTADTVKVTGFSERVELGSIGPVKTDSTVVMRVELPGTDIKGLIKRPIRFRGTALDTYDGASWQRRIKDMKTLKKDFTGFFHTGKAREGRRPIEQNILLEPLDTDVIFAATRPVAVAGKFPAVKVDSNGAIYLDATPYSRIRYRAWSDPAPEAASPDGIAAEFLDASAATGGAAGERLSALLEEVLKGRRTDIDKALSIEAHLLKNYGYSLDPKKGGGQNPLDDFLFFSKEGYCEHYATAMAMMLRAAGIPSRIVTGFSEGEWNGFGGYFIVRQSDAHSWVEAYINGSGWMTFDPTPGAGFTAYTRPTRISLYIDMLKFRWNRYIVNYSFADQKRLTGAIESLWGRLYHNLKRQWVLKTRGTGWWYIKGLAIAAAAMLAAWLLFRMSWKKRREVKSKTPRFYIEMLKTLEKKGFRKKDTETPMEFALRVADPHALEITAAFEEERYGGRTLSEAKAARVRSALESIVKKAT